MRWYQIESFRTLSSFNYYPFLHTYTTNAVVWIGRVVQAQVVYESADAKLHRLKLVILNRR